MPRPMRALRWHSCGSAAPTFWRQNDARQSALAEVRKAFANGADVAEAHAALGDIKFLYDWDVQGAEREYRADA